jgi:hypothetical protein
MILLYTKRGTLDVKLVYLIWGVLLKHAVKIDSMVKFSAVDSSACCPCTPRVSLVDHQRVAYRCRSADCHQRYWHHAIELGRCGGGPQ